MSIKPLHFAVFGDPISHSQSPRLFRKAFATADLPHTYTRVLCDQANQVQSLFEELQLSGANLTAPLKEGVVQADFAIPSPEVHALGAANTLVKEGISFRLFNTDPDGVRLALDEALPGDSVQRALVLGAGGSAKAALWALQHMDLAARKVCNRHDSRAQAIAQKHNARMVPWAQRRQAVKEAQLIISCLPAVDLTPVLDGAGISDQHIILEADYKRAPFQEPCNQSQARYVSGLHWLHHQAQAAADHFGLDMQMPPLHAEPSDEVSSQPVKRLCLCGFMASGKSTVGPLLADKLGWDFLDLDTLIERQSGRSISDIFSTDGEAAFRQLETQALKELASSSHLVLALGGGATEAPDNQALLHSLGPLLWLHASFDTCLARMGDISTRPLALRGRKFMQELYSKRLRGYHRLADEVIPTEPSNPNDLAQRIADEYRGTLQS